MATVSLPQGVPQLTTFYAYLTAGCNLACRHCWIAPDFQAHGGTGGHLDFDLLAQAVVEGIPLGLNHVKLTGGEPLLHPDFIRIVDLLREHRLGLTIETNGTLLTPDLARYLREKSTLVHISVSLDAASPEFHDAFRGVKGSFEKTCQAIRNLVEVDFRPQVIMSLSRDNFGEVESLVNLANDLGANSVKFNIIQSSGRGALLNERGHTFDIQKLIEIGYWIENDLRKRVSIPLIYSWPMAFYSINHLMNFVGYSCHIKNILGIIASGHYALCGIGTQESELVYGKIGQYSLKDIWVEHPKLIELREQLPSGLQGICGDCIFRDQCLAICVAQNYHIYREITAPNWFCDEANRLGLFPDSRKRS